MFACMCGRVTSPFANNQGGKALLVLYTNSVTTSKLRKKEGKEGAALLEPSAVMGSVNVMGQDWKLEDYW